MKSVRVNTFGEPNVLQIEEVPDLKPNRSELIIDVKAVGINPVDTYIRAGIHYKPELPYTPGYDCSGIIKSLGSDIKSLKVGDRVYTHDTVTGAYAEESLCTVDQVHNLPDKLSFQEGAAIGVPYTTAYRSLFKKAKVQKGETLLIHGASGGVGIAAVQLAKLFGMRILATAGTNEGKKLVDQEGADIVFDHNSKNYLNEIMSATNGQGVNVILEMLADKNLASDLSILSKGGRVIIIGCRGTIEINPRDTMSRELSIIGMTVRSASTEESAEIHQALIKNLESGSIKPIINREFPLAQASEAHKVVMQPGAKGKLVLITNQ